jgi:hypothetical protein
LKENMKIYDEYTPFITQMQQGGSVENALKATPHLKKLKEAAEEWGGDLKNVETWILSKPYENHKKIASNFIKQAQEVLAKVEKTFGQELVGEIRLGPSLMMFDGFARYELGSHTIWFGVDHPDADEDYLRVLMSHELSHVYRDHQPDIWGFLGKPLEKVTRQEYLDAGTAEEHLISEGLATLFSQHMYPDVELHVHHYYTPDEMKWCLENHGHIEKSILDTLKGDQNVWKYYEENVVASGSPSRVQYYWAARRINEMLESGKTSAKDIINLHEWNSKKFSFLD